MNQLNKTRRKEINKWKARNRESEKETLIELKEKLGIKLRELKHKLQSSKMIEILQEDIIQSAHYLILLKGIVIVAGEEFAKFDPNNHDELINIISSKISHTIKHK